MAPYETENLQAINTLLMICAVIGPIFAVLGLIGIVLRKYQLPGRNGLGYVGLQMLYGGVVVGTVGMIRTTGRLLPGAGFAVLMMGVALIIELLPKR